MYKVEPANPISLNFTATDFKEKCVIPLSYMVKDDENTTFHQLLYNNGMFENAFVACDEENASYALTEARTANSEL